MDDFLNYFYIKSAMRVHTNFYEMRLLELDYVRRM